MVSLYNYKTVTKTLHEGAMFDIYITHLHRKITFCSEIIMNVIICLKKNFLLVYLFNGSSEVYMMRKQNCTHFLENNYVYVK